MTDDKNAVQPLQHVSMFDAQGRSPCWVTQRGIDARCDTAGM
jgi:hypothetical protein